MLQTPGTLGFFLCSPGLPGEPSDRQPGQLLASPRALAKPRAAGWDASGLFFSLDSSTYFANDPFPSFTPNYTSIGSNAL